MTAFRQTALLLLAVAAAALASSLIPSVALGQAVVPSIGLGDNAREKAEPVYQVDLIIIRNLGAGASRESLPEEELPEDFFSEEFSIEAMLRGETMEFNETPVELPEAADSTDEVLNEETVEESVEEEDLWFKLLAAEETGLQDEAARLQNSAYYDVLVHTSWQQNMYSKDEAEAFDVSYAGADPLVINGTVRLYRERYTHLELTLNLPPKRTGFSVMSRPPFELHQSRKIKLRDGMQYFDHPQFGVIALVTEIEQVEETYSSLGQ